MEQPTFGELEYESKKRKTRREIFLERMDGLIPWRQLEARIRPHYPKAGRGRRPYPLSVMLRIYCVQLFYNLSDPGMEDMLYGGRVGATVCGAAVVGCDAGRDDDTELSSSAGETRVGVGSIGGDQSSSGAQGVRLREGTIIDASIIEAPSTTKNRAGRRDLRCIRRRRGISGISG